MRKLAIILISLMTAFAGLTPVHAFPSVNMTTEAKKVDVVEIRDRRIIRRHGRHYGRHHGRHYGRHHFNRRFDRRYGHYRRYDRGHYRRHYGRHYGRYYDNDAGAIIGGLAAGAIIGGIVNSQPRYYREPRVYYGGNDHVRYCYARYRSYRASDNTYQPYGGPRRQCR